MDPTGTEPQKRGKPAGIARVQILAVLILAVAGVINYVDRGSLAIANTTIRGDLGMSATRMGVLLSVFSMVYALSQLPIGVLLDRFGYIMIDEAQDLNPVLLGVLSRLQCPIVYVGDPLSADLRMAGSRQRDGRSDDQALCAAFAILPFRSGDRLSRIGHFA
jgi:MFS family permease